MQVSFDITVQLRADNPALLPSYHPCRPCCVGLTDQWVHQRVSSEHYRLWYAKLCSDVGNYFGDNKGAQGQQQQRDNNSTGQRAPSTARVQAEREYRCERGWCEFHQACTNCLKPCCMCNRVQVAVPDAAECYVCLD